MEDGGGDLDFSSLPSSCSMDSFIDEILKADSTHACTHTHTCNPPSGPDPTTHTHTCLHVHTKILSPAPNSTDNADTADSDAPRNPRKQRPCGNREAVRKYREKKKARAASLEDEVVQLRALNQQLMKRLQNQAALEAEVARLRCLLVDIRGRIEGEIGCFPYQKPVMPASAAGNPANMLLGSCENLRCDDSRVYCVGGAREIVPGNGNGQECGGACDIGNARCMGSSSSGSKEFFVCGIGNGSGGIAGDYSADVRKNKGCLCRWLCPAVATSPIRLARFATKLTASKICSASTRVSTHRCAPSAPQEAAALDDCADTLRDAVERKRQSAAEIGLLDGAAAKKNVAGAPEVAWRVSNVQTWMSGGAITDETTCADGFDAVAGASSVKADVVRQVGMVKQYTSNALALVNILIHDP